MVFPIGCLSIATFLGIAAPLSPDAAELECATALQGLLTGTPTLAPAPAPSLEVLRADYSRVEPRRSVLLTPLRIGGTGFPHGLGTHAASIIRVNLPDDAARFTAKVGIDDNYDTGGLRGSVVFAVRADDVELFHSDVLRGPAAAAEVDVDVSTERRIDLVLTNAEDGDSHDQADWADAAIHTADGEALWLDEMPIRDQTWLPEEPPFSFILGGVPSRELLPGWDRAGDDGSASWTDPNSGLRVTCESRRFAGPAAVEWVLHFENTGDADTPLIEDIRPLDLTLQRGGGPREAFTLHGARGSDCAPEDFEPLGFRLDGQARADLAARGGRSSNGHLPFFNLDAIGRGLCVAVGWSGQWSASAEPDDVGRYRIHAGMEATRLVLRPGERIRTPRILVVPWEADALRGHNHMRRLIYDHYTPLVGGEKPLPGVQCNSWFPVGDDGNLANAQNQIELLEAYEGLGIEYLVMDAGWFEGGWPLGVGSWVPRRDVFPDGLRPIGEAAERCGIGFGMWFEPERVYEGSLVDREHPEWLISFPDNPTRLLNLGLPDAQDWLIEMVSGYVRDVPLAYFRHDFNMDPLAYWQAADEPDRTGMTQIRYIEGLYRVWDEIHAHFPDLLMEGCSSGGRRIDLESLSRCHIYWKTDLYGQDVPNQGHLRGASLYLPGNYLNTPLFDLSEDAYSFRSLLGGALCAGWDPRREGFDRDRAAARIARFKELRHLAVGEFYPLLPHSLSAEGWNGYQFHRPDLGEGMILLFRQADSPFVTVDLRLAGLEPEAEYELTDEDTARTWTASGAELAEGLRLMLEDAPSSMLILYRAR